jgi:glycosyltransferase involved in cell wall biosynthesis
VPNSIDPPNGQNSNLNIAPVILFAYNRPNHTAKTLQALAQANLANQSELHIFADGVKDPNSRQEVEAVNGVREIIRAATGFKKVVLREHETNLGLANSVINGIDQVLATHDRVITIEDDVIVGKHFLEYVNEALELYTEDDRVLMVSGYGFNLPLSRHRKKAFFLPIGSTQAWGTWKRAWRKIDFGASGYERLNQSRSLRWQFNQYGGINFSEMLVSQIEADDDRISSWAIRFEWSRFVNHGLTLFPPQNMIENIGWDGSGKHSGTFNPYRDDVSRIHQAVSAFPRRVRSKKVDFLLLILFFYRMQVAQFFRARFS